MNLSVIGVGYVGLVSGTCFAETGNNVMCMDVNLQKIDSLKRNEIFMYEPKLEKIFNRVVKEEKLHFTSDLKIAVDHADIIFLALPTPDGKDGSSDLQFVLKVAEQIGKLISSYKIIVNKSTVPVGTTELVREKIALNYKGEFDVASNPEFLREGNAVEDFMKPARVVIGSSQESVKNKLTHLYEPYMHQGNSILTMDEKSAELTKYVANAMLATKISFMNEISQFAEKVDANIDYVRKGVGLDSRIGNSFLYAGVGYGGSCFPKDVNSLIFQQEQAGFEAPIIKAVAATNKKQKIFFFDKIKNYFKDLSQLHFAIWGLAFKPNTDDVREAPAIACIDFLLDQGASVSVFDPEAQQHIKNIYNDRISYGQTSNAIVKGVDALIIMTEWREFAAPDFNTLKDNMKKPIIFDGRNMFAISKMKKQAFDYISVGRPPVYNYTKQV